MVPPADDDGHECGWKAYADHQQTALSEVQTQLKLVTEQLESLKKQLLGKKSERRKSKMPPAAKRKPTAKESQDKRAENAEARDAGSEHVTTEGKPVTCCGGCGSSNIKSVGGKTSTQWEYVSEHFRKRTHKRPSGKCGDCGSITTAPPLPRVGEKTRYAPSFIAHLIFSKWSSSMPQYRLEKKYAALGIPVSRSTMCDLVHRAADELKPIYDRAMETLQACTDLHADETSIRQQGLDKKAFVWVFVSGELTVYHYATTRSGKVPKKILGDSPGRIVVDAYTGYNSVTKLGNRVRCGCLAHARRKIYEQKELDGFEWALDRIGEIYEVERRAKERGIEGEQLLELRRRHSRHPFAQLLWWARGKLRTAEPRSKKYRALHYIIQNSRALGGFLRYATIPPDNNKAEAALRRIAVGRQNYLFVGHEKSGQDHALLYTLVSSCERHGVNPLDYLTDVLIRVQHHPASRLDELLPHRWRPPDQLAT